VCKSLIGETDLAFVPPFAPDLEVHKCKIIGEARIEKEVQVRGDTTERVALRTEFRGQRWFPANESYHVTARFVPYDQPKSVAIPNVLGSSYQEKSPGYALFTLQGWQLRLEPVIDDKELFFIFRDQTAAKETYGAGRFLYTEMPRDGKIELDFNKAENPPCAFTPYATCPLPPKQNILPIRIEAGELAPAVAVEHTQPSQ